MSEAGQGVDPTLGEAYTRYYGEMVGYTRNGLCGAGVPQSYIKAEGVVQNAFAKAYADWKGPAHDEPHATAHGASPRAAALRPATRPLGAAANSCPAHRSPGTSEDAPVFRPGRYRVAGSPPGRSGVHPTSA